MAPLAYFLSFTTYGTWLHGSSKGQGSVDRDHNRFDTPFVAPDTLRELECRSEMIQPPFVMGAPERDIVCQSIVTLAQERGWCLHAVHVRTNHVHVVLSADRDPGRILSDFKARASRDLTRAGFDTADRRRWTRHGSTRHLYREQNVIDAIHYVLYEQGEPMACYPNPKEPRTK
jgi:hypothetical protein